MSRYPPDPSKCHATELEDLQAAYNREIRQRQQAEQTAAGYREALEDMAIRRGRSEWDEPFQKCGLCRVSNDGDAPLSHAHNCPLANAALHVRAHRVSEDVLNQARDAGDRLLGSLQQEEVFGPASEEPSGARAAENFFHGERLVELEAAVKNIRLSAAMALSFGHQATPQTPEKMIERKEERLRDILRFCEDVGVTATVLRADAALHGQAAREGE